MRRTSLIILTVVLAFGASAWAAQGTWENTTAEPMAASSGYLAVSAIDDNTAFTIGINQFSANGVQYIWRTTDAGLNFIPIFEQEIGLEGCDVMNLFMFMIDGDWFDIDHGLAVGTGVNPECCPNCMEEGHQFFYCMFACMFSMKPYFWSVTDGGDTIQIHDAEGDISTMYLDIKAINETTMIACGSNGLLRRTDDFGETWVNLTPPETGTSSSMNTMCWLSPEVGYIGTGYTSEEVKSGYSPADPMSAMELYNAQVDFIHYMKGGAWRLALRDAGYHLDYGSKEATGAVYKTVDGGHNWEKILDSEGKFSVYKVQFLDEMHGWIVTDEPSVTNPQTNGANDDVKYTVDGGQTWSTAAYPAQGPGTSDEYIISDLKMLTPDLGYAAGAVAFGMIRYGTTILVTTDGGKTWDHDTLGYVNGYPGNPDGYGLNAMDFASNRRGYAVGMYLSAARYTGTNEAPTADAGEDQTGQVGIPVTLDGTGSSDPDSDTLLFNWTLVDGPADVAFDDAFVAQPTFTPTAAGDYNIQLSVSDGEFSSTDEVLITVAEAPVDDDTSPGDDDDSGTDDDDTNMADDDDDNDNDDENDDDDDSGGCGC